MDHFTVEEINLMCIYDISDRAQLIAEVKDSLPHVYEPEMREIMESVMDKLEHMTDSEYAKIGLFPTGGFWKEV